jgi:hypothetical protein
MEYFSLSILKSESERKNFIRSIFPSFENDKYAYNDFYYDINHMVKYINNYIS